jgi:murein DD-endopeptidase MepM/ murein hydrolase activator NlpD
LIAKKNKSRTWLWCFLFLVVVLPLTILLVKRMEGKAPTLSLEMSSSSLGAGQTLSIDVADQQTGIRQIWVAIFKDGQETVLLDKVFPAGNILMGGLMREQNIELPVEPQVLGFEDGKATLRMVARDFSWRKWGKGNQQYQEHEVMIDTRAPDISVTSSPLYINQGGSGVVIYKLSEDCPISGVAVGDDFYPGYGGASKDPLTRIAFIALNHRQGKDTKLAVTATDQAGNQGRAGLAGYIKAKKFKRDTISLSDNFLNWKLPEFASQVESASGSPQINTFLQINRDMRRENYEEIIKVTSQSEEKILWKGAFMRLPKSANRAGYADFRKYLYKGKTVDEQTHLGIDLASLRNSPVPAANNGKVVHADNIGIYGRTIIIDHGFGLFSLYAHLSNMDVSVGRMVSKGDIIGSTGKTGLAGGDHLHYSMLVQHTFINPLEWWDPHWIQDNILSKIGSLQ